MTTVITSILNHSYWENIPSDSSIGFDALFTSNFPSIFNDKNYHDSDSMNDELGEISSPTIDQKQLQISQLANLKCGVCGAPATGYNFDQITCESCKAFFRRNAFRDMRHMKCRLSGTCVMNVRTRRHCAYCRLKKCFDIKMRKDWIRTDEERELRQLKKLVKGQKHLNELTDNQQSRLNLPIVMRKKKRLMIKPKIEELIVKPAHTQTFFGFNRNLSKEDQILLNNITNAYQLVTDQVDMLALNQMRPLTTLIEFINEESRTHESLIKFYKSIPQFSQLDLNDRILLIKFNFVKIVHLHCILIQKFQENPLIGVYMSKWISKDFHDQMSRTRRYFDRFIENPLILKLALIVFIFSINLSAPSYPESDDDYTNKKNIREIQDSYITVFWRYLNSVYDEKEARRSLEIITTQILHYQTLMVTMEEYVKREISKNPVLQLESSLFRLT